jgi:hypothetical protein
MVCPKDKPLTSVIRGMVKLKGNKNYTSLVEYPATLSFKTNCPI